MKRYFIITFGTLALLSVLIVVNYYLSKGSVGPQEDKGFVLPQQRENTEEKIKDGALAKVAPELLALFPGPNDWRRTSGNVIATVERDAFFIFKGQPSFSREGNVITLDACTVVFMPNGAATDYQDEEEQARAAIIFESTDSVDLQFSKSLLEVVRSENFDLNISSFINGQFHGSVVIRSEFDPRTHDDDLFLQTRNVVFTTKQIRTSYEVSFRFGKNYGAGRGMTIDLEIPSEFQRHSKTESEPGAASASEDAANAELASKGAASGRKNLSIAEQVDLMVDEGNLGGGFSLRQVEIDEITDYARFYFNSSSLEERSGLQRARNEEEESDDYIAVRCKKDVLFAPNPYELGGWCARFSKDVDLIYFQREEKKANLKCDRLFLYLQDEEIAKFVAGNPEAQHEVKRKKLVGKLQNLVPTVVRAQRSDEKRAAIDVFDQQTKILAGEFQYNLKTGVVDLTAYNGREPVRIQKYESRSDSDEPSVDFAAANIQARLNSNYELLSIIASSNGSIVLKLKDGSGQTRLAQVSWQDGLQAIPELQLEGVVNLVASGSVNFNIQDLGNFNANEVNFWCKFSEDEKGAPNDADLDATLHHASYARAELAQTYAARTSSRAKKKEPKGFPVKPYKNVAPIAARMSGDVAFRSPGATAKIQNAVTVRFDPNPFPQDARPQGSTPSRASTGALAGAVSSQKRKNSFTLAGGSLTLWCKLLGVGKENDKRAFELYRMQLVQNASLTEMNADTGEIIAQLNADLAVVDNPNNELARIEIRGEQRDAKFQTKSLTLSGRNVVVDRAANTFAVSGEGNVAIRPIDARQKIESKPTLNRFFTPDPIDIKWSDSMVFNGSQLIFKSNDRESVALIQRQTRGKAQIAQTLTCAEARVTLKRPISLFDFNSQDKSALEVKQIECLSSGQYPVNARITGVEGSKVSELYEAFFASVLFDLETQRARAPKGGEIFAAIQSENAPNVLPESLGQSNAAPRSGKRGWIRAHTTFVGELNADLERRNLVVENLVQLVVAEVDDPKTVVKVTDAPLADGASKIKCDKATIQLLELAAGASTARKEPSFEVNAQGNVTIRRDEYQGICDSLRYSAAKELVVLTASDSSRGALYKQKGAGATRENLGNFSRCDIKLKPFSYSFEGISKFN